MSNLRWILLLTGVAILLVLYISGRPQKAGKSGRNARGRRALTDQPGDELEDVYGEELGALDADFSDLAADPATVSATAAAGPYVQHPSSTPHAASNRVHGISPDYDPLLAEPVSGDSQQAHHYSQTQATAYGEQPPFGDQTALALDSHRELARSYAVTMEADPQSYVPESQQYDTMQQGSASEYDDPTVAPTVALDPHDMERPGGSPAVPERRKAQARSRNQQGSGGTESSAFSRTLGALGLRLGGNRSGGSDAEHSNGESEPFQTDDINATGIESYKLLVLHVVAAEGSVIDQSQLLQVLEHRGYHFGEKNIFHYLQNGRAALSLAKIVEPGYFDPEDLTSFNTPGITLFCELPGPIRADQACDFLINEAQELARALDCHVLDAQRSSLSRQTIQHMRDDIRNYMLQQSYPATGS